MMRKYKLGATIKFYALSSYKYYYFIDNTIQYNTTRNKKMIIARYGTISVVCMDNGNPTR